MLERMRAPRVLWIILGIVTALLVVSYFLADAPISAPYQSASLTLQTDPASRAALRKAIEEAIEASGKAVPKNNDTPEFANAGMDARSKLGEQISAEEMRVLAEMSRLYASCRLHGSCEVILGGTGSTAFPPAADGSGKTPGSPPTAALPWPSPVAAFAAESVKIDSLVQGSAAISAPSTTRQGRSFPVLLRVSPKELAVVMQSLKYELPENLTVKGRQGIKLTPRMAASVAGFGFEISPKGEQIQAVSGTEETTWMWQVKAIDSGPQTLTFTLSGTLMIEGKEVARNFYSYQQRVHVDVAEFDMGDFIAQQWQWLMTSLAIPAVGTLWAIFRKPSNDEGKKAESLYERLRKRRRFRSQ